MGVGTERPRSKHTWGQSAHAERPNPNNVRDRPTHRNRIIYTPQNNSETVGVVHQQVNWFTTIYSNYPCRMRAKYAQIRSRFHKCFAYFMSYMDVMRIALVELILGCSGIYIYIYMSKYCRPIRRHTYYYMFIDLQPHMIRRHWLCWLICVGGFCDLWARMRYKFCDFGQYGFWGLSKFVCVIPIWIPSIPFHINVVCWYYLNRIDIVRCVHRPQTFRCEIVLYIQNIWYVQWSVSFLCCTTPNQSSNGSNQLHIHPLWI